MTTVNPTDLKTIPLNLLIRSTVNVRKTDPTKGVEELAASIEAHGLLQNLQVRPADRGRFEVVAGGRRLEALNILRRQKKLAKDFPVPCQVLGEADPLEISLAENAMREAMHPADEFEAFQALIAQGRGAEEIAARFGVSPTVVRQRLRLASVSPTLIDLYRSQDMTLDQLMAFTLSEDHAAQEAAWFGQRDWNRSPHSIRATLTATKIAASDRRVLFIGVETYLAAGGEIFRDLFEEDHEGYLTNPALVDRLVSERLEREAEVVRLEGWAWVSAAPRRDPVLSERSTRVRPEVRPLSEEDDETHFRLVAEYECLLEEAGDRPLPHEEAQMASLWKAIDNIEAKTKAFRPEDIARGGAILTIDYDGALCVERGFVRVDETAAPQREADDQEGAAPKLTGLSVGLVESLTAERTAALRACLMDDRQIALASLCHVLALGCFYGYQARGSCLQLRLTSRGLEGCAESKAQRLIAERYEAWMETLPSDADALFDWLKGQASDCLQQLLAFCAAQSIDAVSGKLDGPRDARLIHADTLATALRLDMRDWWSPTRERYLGRIPKKLVLEAVREGVSEQVAENLSGLKKDQLVAAAETRLADKGWLPQLLRTQATPDAADDCGAVELMAAE